MKNNKKKIHLKQRLSNVKSQQNFQYDQQQHKKRKKKLQGNGENKKNLQYNEFNECNEDKKKIKTQQKSKMEKGQPKNGQIFEDYKKIKQTQKNMCFLLDKIKDKYIKKQNMLLSIVQATISELRQIQNSISNSLDKTKQQQIDLIQPEIYQFFINSKKIKRITNNNLKQHQINIQNTIQSGTKILDKLQRIQINLNPFYQQADSFCNKLKQFQICLNKPLLQYPLYQKEKQQLYQKEKQQLYQKEKQQLYQKEKQQLYQKEKQQLYQKEKQQLYQMKKQQLYQKEKQVFQSQFLQNTQNSFQKISKIMTQGNIKEKQDVCCQDKQQEKIIQMQNIQINKQNSHINTTMLLQNQKKQYQKTSVKNTLIAEKQQNQINQRTQLKQNKQNKFYQSLYFKNQGRELKLNQRKIKKNIKTQNNQIKEPYFFNNNNQQDFKNCCKATFQQSILNKDKHFNTFKVDKKSISIERLLQNLKTKQFKKLSQSCQKHLKQCRSVDNITKLNFNCFKQFNLNLDNINKKLKNQQELFVSSKTIKQSMSQRSSRSKFNILDILRKQKCKFQAIKNSIFI